MFFWEWSNVILTKLTPPPLRGWLCRLRGHGWPWWCQQQLDEARERARERLAKYKEA